MNTAIKNNEPQQPTTLAGLVNIGKIGAEARFGLDNKPKLRFLTQEICARNGGAIALSKEHVISSQFIVLQMSCNYANILTETINSMSYKFTKDNLITLLQVNCSAIWQTDFFKTPLQMVIDFYQINSIDDLDKNPDLKDLVEKLEQLSVVENYALVDVCEQFWRNKRSGSFRENFKQLRLELA
jgi:hypothetical protein